MSLWEIAKETPSRHNWKYFSVRETKLGFRIKITFMVERCRSKEGRVTPHYQPISNTLLPFTSLQKWVRPFHPRVWRASQKSKNLHYIIANLCNNRLVILVNHLCICRYLCSDLVYVILFPQLLLVVHWDQGVTTYGCLASYVVGLTLRVLGLFSLYLLAIA